MDSTVGQGTLFRLEFPGVAVRSNRTLHARAKRFPPSVFSFSRAAEPLRTSPSRSDPLSRAGSSPPYINPCESGRERM